MLTESEASGLRRRRHSRNVFVGAPLAQLFRRVPPFTQILPVRIHGRDQVQLLATHPAFDLLLACDGRPDVCKRLVVEQPVDVVPLRESLDLLGPMLPDTAPEVSRDAGVECA